MWSQIFLIISLILTIVLFLPARKSENTFRIRFFFILTLSVLLAGEILIINLPDFDLYISGWYRVVSISLCLTLLAMIIREYKPVYSRNPSLFVYLPLLIIPAYLFIFNIDLLSNLLNLLLQGGALLVTTLLFFLFLKKIDQPLKMLTGLIIMAVLFILYWFFQEIRESYLWLYRLLFSAAVILLGYSFEEIINQLTSPKTVS